MSTASPSGNETLFSKDGPGRTLSGPEHQQVRLPAIEKLVTLGWKREQLQWKPEWRVPKSPHDAAKRETSSSFSGWPVDLVLFQDEDHIGSWEYVLVVFEFKAPNLMEGVSQLEIYLNREPRARMGYWTNGTEDIRVYRLADGTFKHLRNHGLPQPGENFSKPSEKPLTYGDLKPAEINVLKSVFYRLLNVIVARDSVSTRSEARLNEICNLLLIKMESDTIGQDEPDRPLDFQLSATEHATAANLDQQFKKLRSRRPQIFADTMEESIRLDDHSIHQAVYELSGLDLLTVRPEALSAAFQIFRTANLKAGEGQYYTPSRVIEAAVSIMDIRVSDRVIDPACGTGGFLSEAYLQLLERAGRSQGPNALANARTWAHRNLYGIDRDQINVKLTRAILMGLGDGSVNVISGDSIREDRWEKDYPKLGVAMDNAQFSVVITNPPFGQNLKVSKSDSARNKYTIARKGGSETDPYHDVEIGLVFIERAFRLLEKGGRLGIVLPETYFFSSSYSWFPKWLDCRFILRGVVNIPMEAFQGFCRAKTNFYIFEKV
ncbi:hypothetical protein AYK61_21895 [Rhodococcus sp. SBT000017]|uniref:HsdM family class I SAM-dependent methyltransferase n=1 Tax=Rhodococcus sp. SBT000017 TaxID=1803385 RepID=UPI000EF8D2EC|nr:N-6 DNA methylase [Rhodococcus sp. SBT000017]RMB71835.1 hypothetical protein AYK61_21895 [Rhodococcus sp. SBT000017]